MKSKWTHWIIRGRTPHSDMFRWIEWFHHLLAWQMPSANTALWAVSECNRVVHNELESTLSTVMFSWQLEKTFAAPPRCPKENRQSGFVRRSLANIQRQTTNLHQVVLNGCLFHARHVFVNGANLHSFQLQISLVESLLRETRPVEPHGTAGVHVVVAPYEANVFVAGSNSQFS